MRKKFLVYRASPRYGTCHSFCITLLYKLLTIFKLIMHFLFFAKPHVSKIWRIWTDKTFHCYFLCYFTLQVNVSEFIYAWFIWIHNSIFHSNSYKETKRNKKKQLLNLIKSYDRVYMISMGIWMTYKYAVGWINLKIIIDYNWQLLYHLPYQVWISAMELVLYIPHYWELNEKLSVKLPKADWWTWAP